MGASLCRLFAHKQALAATANALLLQKCLRQRMWDNSSMECMQLQGVGKQTSKLLATASMGRLRQLAAADPRKIEAVTQRHYPFGMSRQSTASSWKMVLLCRDLEDTCRRTLLGERCDSKDPVALLAGNTLKQHLQTVMPPQLNLNILARGESSVWCILIATHRNDSLTHSFIFGPGMIEGVLAGTVGRIFS